DPRRARRRRRVRGRSGPRTVVVRPAGDAPARDTTGRSAGHRDRTGLGHRGQPPPPGTRAGCSVIRIVVVDDHPVVRDGVAAVLSAVADFEVVGQADSGPAAVERAAALAPDVVVMDLRMPGGNGVDAVRAL